MSETRWTKGPLYALGRTVMTNPTDVASLGVIAECRARRGPVVITPEEAEANARLFAAAPDLYAALRAIYAADGYNSALAEQAERALQKAQGR